MMTQKGKDDSTKIKGSQVKTGDLQGKNKTGQEKRPYIIEENRDISLLYMYVKVRGEGRIRIRGCVTTNNEQNDKQQVL